MRLLFLWILYSMAGNRTNQYYFSLFFSLFLLDGLTSNIYRFPFFSFLLFPFLYFSPSVLPFSLTRHSPSSSSSSSSHPPPPSSHPYWLLDIYCIFLLGPPSLFPLYFSISPLHTASSSPPQPLITVYFFPLYLPHIPPPLPLPPGQRASRGVGVSGKCSVCTVAPRYTSHTSYPTYRNI